MIEGFVKSDLDKSMIILPWNENLEYVQPKTNTGLFLLIDLSPAFLSFLVSPKTSTGTSAKTRSVHYQVICSEAWIT